MIIIILILLFPILGCSSEKDNWAQAKLQELTLEQKIGQLFIVPACQLREEEHLEDLRKLYKNYFIGGVILKQGNPLGQIRMINALQEMAEIPLLCVQDAEWGLAMRLENTVKFPKNLTLGAIQDENLIFKLGAEVGRQCKIMGVHVNLAPCVDVNNNPLNPIIHMRSFGENPEKVAQKSLLWMQGLQSQGVHACAKHFPGHGDTAVDSHKDLPIISHSIERLKDVELIPFAKLIEGGVFSVMSAHLLVQALDDVPATLSNKVIDGLLKDEMGFQGIVITDALNMKGLCKSFSTEEIARHALIAGNDLLLYGDHIGPNVDEIIRALVPKAISAIKQAYEKGEITIERIDASVLKILKAKESLGLFVDPFVPSPPNLLEELHSNKAKSLKKELFAKAMTLVANDGQVPLQGSVALLVWGKQSPFAYELKKYVDVREFMWDEKDQLLSQKEEFSSIVVSIEEKPEKELIEFLSSLSKCVVVLFGSPYQLFELPFTNATLVAYEKEKEAYESAAEVLSGKLIPQGKLPVTIDDKYNEGMGL